MDASGMRTVVMPDGSMHVERTVGNLRIDLTTGEQSVVIGAPNTNMTQVIRPNGSVAMETTFGNLRTSTDGYGPVHILP